MTARRRDEPQQPARTIPRAALELLVAELTAQRAIRLAAAAFEAAKARELTLKDIPNPHRAAARARRDTLDPFPDGDLKAAGMQFVDLPVVEVRVTGVEQWRVARREADVGVERVELASEWVRRQS